MARRQGTTLIEVLVAIFIMAIGLIALLVLFPLGALRMAQAIQDDRCATAAANANAIATMKNVRHDLNVITPLGFPANTDVFRDAIPAAGRNLAADPEGPSYPVFVDPIGVQNALFGSASQAWLGIGGNYNTQGLIARSHVSWALGTNSFKWFSLLDDLNFDANELTGGVPLPPALQRDTRYSWAYLVQRPRAKDPLIATCSVVVYNKRPLSLTNTLLLSEAAYTATSFNLATNTISVDSTPYAPPNVRTGEWILDCTYVKAGGYGSAHAYFYRVVGVTETGPTTLDYEVQQPLRGFAASGPGTIMVLEGVAEVYERGLDRKFD